jgi:hypothetical protein
MLKIAGSGSISQRHGSADPDPDPDPHQNVMDPQNCFDSCRACNIHHASVPGEAAGLHLLALQLQPEPEGQAAAATASAAAGGQQLGVQEDEERPPQHTGKE